MLNPKIYYFVKVRNMLYRIKSIKSKLQISFFFRLTKSYIYLKKKESKVSTFLQLLNIDDSFYHISYLISLI